MYITKTQYTYNINLLRVPTEQTNRIYHTQYNSNNNENILIQYIEIFKANLGSTSLFNQVMDIVRSVSNKSK